MCGISGIMCQEKTNGLNIFKSLLALQHRGQDGAGIFWSHNSTHKMIKGQGLVNQVFDIDKLKQMKGSLFVAHNRYKTNNIPNSYQPYFYACSYLSVCVSHNGNIINCHSIKKY